MSCNAMHPIQDLFLESFSYVLQFDMHFYMHTYLDKKIILVKSGCYSQCTISMLGWAWCGFHKKLIRTSYAEHVFLHHVGSMGHVVYSSVFGA
jgi:hypothetical protein